MLCGQQIFDIRKEGLYYESVAITSSVMKYGLEKIVRRINFALYNFHINDVLMQPKLHKVFISTRVLINMMQIVL